LDDLTIFRQYNRTDTTKRFDLFKPSDAYRISGGSALDATADDEDGPE
jgi:hypothetical protein